MAKGIIYIMTTVVPGLIKIGKAGKDNFKQRMYNLEHNGYCNVTALKRVFAIEVDDYDEKEDMLQTIFKKSQVGNTELFALDVNIAIQLLSSFEGKIIYPEHETKEEAFREATDDVIGNEGGDRFLPGNPANFDILPDGNYTMSCKLKATGITVKGSMTVVNGCYILKKGSIVAPESERYDKCKDLFIDLKIKDNVLLEDHEFKSVSTAATVVRGKSTNGWTSWVDKNGEYIDKYRNKKDKENN